MSLASSAERRVSAVLTQLAPNLTAQTAVTTGASSSSSTQLTGPPANVQYGGALAAQALKEQGVTHVFTLTGGHIAPILVGCEQAGIRVVDVRDEATTVFAADATTRLTGVVGVAIVTAGPGLTNTVTAVKNAQLAQVPVVLFAGATAIILKGRGSLQDIDQLELMKSAVKASWSIRSVREIIPTIRKAFSIAQSGVPGPVFIEYPIESLWPEQTIAEQIGVKQAPPLWPLTKHSLTQNIKHFYLQRHVQNVFAGAWDPPKPLGDIRVPFVPVPHSAVTRAAQMLAQARSPVLLIGSQAIRAGPPLSSSGSAGAGSSYVAQLKSSLEILGCPVFLSGMARGLLGRLHPLLLRHNRSRILKKSDLVILAGVPADFRLDYGRHIPPTARFITVNLCSATLAKNADIRRADLAVLADPMNFVFKLAEVAPTPSTTSSSTPASTPTSTSFRQQQFIRGDASWSTFLRQQQESREKEIDKMASKEASSEIRDAQGNTFVNPLRLCRILDEILPENCRIIADGGDFVGTASYTVKPRKALSWLDPGVYGTLGVGGGFALASALHFPTDTTVILYGDGSCGWGLMEFDTYVRMKTPIIAVIGNDACWSQMYRDQVRLLKSAVATELAFTHYEKVVEGLGAKGILVRAEKEIRPAFEQAIKWTKEGFSVCINCMIAKSGFREGSISL